MNHHNNDSSHQFHLCNIPYVKNMVVFYEDCIFLHQLQYLFFKGFTVSPIVNFLITGLSGAFFLWGVQNREGWLSG